MAITFYTETMSKIGFKRDHLRASRRLKQFQVREINKTSFILDGWKNAIGKAESYPLIFDNLN